MKRLNIGQLKDGFKKRSVDSIAKSICAEFIGTGMYRDVYVYKHNSEYVVKIERDPSRSVFANVSEWLNYINHKEWGWFEKWLAPCEAINETGQILIQKRVYWDGKKKSDYPKKIPTIFTDTKYKNFGWIENRLVCCDYSFLVIKSIEMRRARWWGNIQEARKIKLKKK